jgi:hypothetical protein
MQLNPAAFDSFLRGIGQKLEWRRSYACACVSPASGAPDPKHALCAGKGRIWEAAVPTVAGVASQSVTAEWMQSGQYETGDMVLSIPQASAMYNAGQFDRILMKNSTDTFSMPMTHGAPTERLLFSVQNIQRVFWLHPTTRLIVEGGIPVVSATGTLTWPNGGEPPPGFVYSLTGNKYDEYFIFGAYLSDRGEHQGARLPKKVVARKWDLFGR